MTLVDNLRPQYGGNRFNIFPIRDRIDVHIADIGDTEAMRPLVAGQDYLFNLAGQTSHLDSMHSPLEDMRANVQAHLELLETCRHHNPGLRIVFASTRQIYGRPQYLPVDEKHPLNPVDVNGVNKLACEMYHTLYHRVYGLRACVLRLTNTYGPRMRVRDDRQTFLGTWIQRLVDGQPLKIFGDGSQLRDFNYVDDVVDAMLLVSEPGSAGKVYNLGASEVVDLLTLARRMIAIHGKGSYEVIDFPPERKRIDIGHYYADSSLIETELGWRPRTGLDAGLARSLAYFETHREHYWP